MPISCIRCGQLVQDGMAFCPNCGTPAVPSSGQGTYPVQPPPVYSVQPQFAPGPYPAPGYVPVPFYYAPPNPKRSAAGGGCILMILDGALAIPMWLLLLAEWEPVSGVFLMAASLVAIIGGSLALKGILPLLAAAGPPLLIMAAVVMATVTFFLVIVAIIGIILAVISLVLVLYGWSDLMMRTEMRNRRANPFHY